MSSNIADPTDPNDLFVQQYLPEIQQRSRAHYARLNPEAREEAVQESICMAWKMFRSAYERGKIGGNGHPTSGDSQVTPCTLAWFANLAYDSGRRFAGSSTTDAMAEGTRVVGRSRMIGLDELDSEGLAKAMTDHRHESDPAELARTRLDWSAFHRSDLLNAKGKRALPLLAAGYRNGELARELGVCDARSTQIWQMIGEAAAEFFGADIKPVVRKRVHRQKGGRAKRRRRGARRTRHRRAS